MFGVNAMEIIKLDQNSKATPCVVALGNFDGVHQGHKILLDNVKVEAEYLDVPSAVLLFTQHTKDVLNHGQRQKILTNKDQKLDILNALGIDIVYEVEFNKRFMSLSPKEFVKNVLVDKVDAKGVVVGFDYTFGYKASGNQHTLKELCQQYKIKTTIIPPIFVDKQMISSTRIRQLIRDGKVSYANRLMGRPYAIQGFVKEGKKYGQTRGVPTANINLNDDYVIPLRGVYDTNIIIEGVKYKAATSVGYNPTFQEKELKIEAHALNFNKNIYHCFVELEFLEYLRPELAFETKDALYDRINKDIEIVKNRVL